MKLYAFITSVIFLLLLSTSSFGGLKIIKPSLVPESEGLDTTNRCSLGCAMSWDVESSSELDSQGNNSYDVTKLDDGLAKTAWVEGVEGDGIGEFILFKFPEVRFTESGLGEKINFNGFLILNGYTKDKKTWRNNSRVKKIGILHNNKPIYVVELFDSMKLQDISFDSIWLHHGDTIKVVIMDVYKGSKYSDTAISELVPSGAH